MEGKREKGNVRRSLMQYWEDRGTDIEVSHELKHKLKRKVPSQLYKVIVIASM